ncbi:aspartyl protease family protein [Tundrisphaera lichenicola]|uniref:aspartyl protease family protein n=1 Tax=Tundrisphaera lichenicola TaxID=2029860 RepID=UPI003EBDD141
MSQSFQPTSRLILIETEVSGPSGKVAARLVLDTGATTTTLNVRLLRSIGYDPNAATESARMATGSAVETVPRLMVNRPSALGRHAIRHQVLAHDLPTEAAVDGLLGLDFFRGLALTIDFRAGRIDLV